MLIFLYINIACTWVGWRISPKRKTMTSGKMLESLVYQIWHIEMVAIVKAQSLGDSAELMTLPLSQCILQINVNNTSENSRHI